MNLQVRVDQAVCVWLEVNWKEKCSVTSPQDSLIILTTSSNHFQILFNLYSVVLLSYRKWKPNVAVALEKTDMGTRPPSWDLFNTDCPDFFPKTSHLCDANSETLSKCLPDWLCVQYMLLWECCLQHEHCQCICRRLPLNSCSVQQPQVQHSDSSRKHHRLSLGFTCWRPDGNTAGT